MLQASGNKNTSFKKLYVKYIHLVGKYQAHLSVLGGVGRVSAVLRTL